jgi:hypothetical protein
MMSIKLLKEDQIITIEGYNLKNLAPQITQLVICLLKQLAQPQMLEGSMWAPQWSKEAAMEWLQTHKEEQHNKNN